MAVDLEAMDFIPHLFLWEVDLEVDSAVDLPAVEVLGADSAAAAASMAAVPAEAGN